MGGFGLNMMENTKKHAVTAPPSTVPWLPGRKFSGQHRQKCRIGCRPQRKWQNHL